MKDFATVATTIKKLRITNVMKRDRITLRGNVGWYSDAELERLAKRIDDRIRYHRKIVLTLEGDRARIETEQERRKQEISKL